MTTPLNKNYPDSQQGSVPEEDENLSLVGEFIVFLKENKKWWLVPLILMIAGLGILVAAGSGPLAPFIYSLF